MSDSVETSPCEIRRNPPVFNERDTEHEQKYVAWLDVMGSQSRMVRSLSQVANFVFKLQIAGFEEQELEQSTGGSSVPIYPMNDGLFAVSERLGPLRRWISGVFERVHSANMRVRGDSIKTMMVRSGVAYGPIIRGENVTTNASAVLDRAGSVRNSVLIGAPVANAYRAESDAPPFGIYVHESARTFGPRRKDKNRYSTWSGSYMRYWKQDSIPEWVREVYSTVDEYLKWSRKHAFEIGYPCSAIEKHMSLVSEYFDLDVDDQ